jgi:hypothetical protein
MKMSTLDQPLFTEGFCPKCNKYLFSVHIGDQPRALKHACGEQFRVQWRRLVIMADPQTCPICTMPTYREATGTDANGAPISDPTQQAATFVVVNGITTRHMCEVPLVKDGEPYGRPVHPDDIAAK